MFVILRCTRNLFWARAQGFIENYAERAYDTPHTLVSWGGNTLGTLCDSTVLFFYIKTSEMMTNPDM